MKRTRILSKISNRSSPRNRLPSHSLHSMMIIDVLIDKLLNSSLTHFIYIYITRHSGNLTLKKNLVHLWLSHHIFPLRSVENMQAPNDLDLQNILPYLSKLPGRIMSSNPFSLTQLKDFRWKLSQFPLNSIFLKSSSVLMRIISLKHYTLIPVSGQYFFLQQAYHQKIQQYSPGRCFFRIFSHHLRTFL